MGGKAFAAHGETVRLPTARMEPLARAIAAAVGARVVEWPRLKADHGDIDLVIPRSVVSALGDEELARRVGAAAGAEHLFRRPDVRDPILFVGLRLPEGLYQVDLISSDDDLADFCTRYLSWGDCGTMIGRMAREMGLTFGQTGLRVPVRVPGAGRDNVLLTGDPDTAITWLGFDAIAHRAGFDDDRAVADFIGAGRWFDPKVYEPERSSSEARRRGRVRRGRDAFNDYITSLPGRFEWPEVKGPSPLQDEFRDAAVARFGKAEEVAAAEARLVASAVRRPSAFNPAAIAAAVGHEDFELRFLTAIVQEDFTGDGEFPAWKASCTPEDVEARVKAAWALYPERLAARIADEERRAAITAEHARRREAKQARKAGAA